MDPRSPTRRLFELAWPIIGINILQVLSLAIDSAMVGRTPAGDDALAGLGFAGQIAFLLTVGMWGLVIGCVALVSRSHGAGDHDRANHVLHQSAQLTIGIGVAVAIVGNIVGGPALTALGADGPAFEQGIGYLRPILIGAPFNFLNLLFAAVLRGVGVTRLAFQVALLMNVLNVMLNVCLIGGNFGFPALGTQGAALGTVISQMVAAGVMYSVIRGGGVPGLAAPLTGVPVDRPLAVDLFRIGWPAALDILTLNAGLLFIIGMLGRIDDAAVGAHSIGLRVQSIAFVPGMSLAQATGAMVGMALGAGNVLEARRVLRSSIVLSTLIMSVLAAILVFFAEPLVGVFTPTRGPLFDYAVLWLSLLGYGMPVLGVLLSVSGLLQGAGDTRSPLWINVALTFGFQIPVGAFLGHTLGWGAFGIWIAFPVSMALKAVCVTVVYRRDLWARTGTTV